VNTRGAAVIKAEAGTEQFVQEMVTNAYNHFGANGMMVGSQADGAHARQKKGIEAVNRESFQ